MNIVRENKDELNAVLRILIEKQDYDQQLGEKLKEYKKNAQLHGFRKGMVPAGIINKMYRKPLLLEQLNKIVSDSLNKYIQEEKLNILGEPLTSTAEQKSLDLDKQEAFEFVFDLALAPKIELALTEKIKIPYYSLKIENKLIDDYIEGLTSRYGKYNPIEVAGEEDLLKGKLEQLNALRELEEGGIAVENAAISIKLLADNTLQAALIGSKIGDTFEIDIVKAFPNEADRAALLKVKKEELSSIDGNFRLTISETLKFDKAEINQELFDQVLGKDVVKNEEEFKTRIKETIAGDYLMDSNYKFFLDARKIILDSLKIELPVEFLKRWILETNEGKINQSDLERDFGQFASDLKWQIVRDHIIRENKIEVAPEEVLEFAKKMTLRQFRNYGLMNVSDAMLENFAQETLKKEEERKKLIDRIYHEKLIDLIKTSVKLDNKELNQEKFAELFKQDS